MMEDSTIPAVFRAAPSILTTSRTHGFWPLIIVGCGYYVGCLAGFALRFPSSGISFFWPPTALLAAALLLTAPRSWTGLLASAFVAHGIAHAQAGVPLAAWPILF